MLSKLLEQLRRFQDYQICYGTQQANKDAIDESCTCRCHWTARQCYCVHHCEQQWCTIWGLCLYWFMRAWEHLHLAECLALDVQWNKSNTSLLGLGTWHAHHKVEPRSQISLTASSLLWVELLPQIACTQLNINCVHFSLYDCMNQNIQSMAYLNWLITFMWSSQFLYDVCCRSATTDSFMDYPKICLEMCTDTRYGNAACAMTAQLNTLNVGFAQCTGASNQVCLILT